MTRQLRQIRLGVASVLVVVAITAPVVLAAARWPSYWLWIASEQTPMTWLQSVVLVLAAATCALAAATLHLRAGHPPAVPAVGRPGRHPRLLVALAGLSVLPLVLRAGPDRSARRLFLVGTALALVSVAVARVDPSTWTLAQERLQQSLEEVVELAAGLYLLGAVVLRLLGLLAPADPAVPGSTPALPVLTGTV